MMMAAEMKERPAVTLMKQTDVQSIYHMHRPRWLFSDPAMMILRTAASKLHVNVGRQIKNSTVYTTATMGAAPHSGSGKISPPASRTVHTGFMAPEEL